MEYKRKSLARGAIILGISGFLAKVIGALYRIPLTNILGAEGMGLYQLVFPLYSLLLTITGSGFSSSIARAISQKLAVEDGEGAKRILRVSLIALGSAGAVAMVLILLLAPAISALQGNGAAALAYYGIAAAVLFAAISATLRGYFQGRLYMTPAAVSQVVEQAVKLALGLGLAAILLNRGLAMAVLGATLGVSVAEGVGAMVLAIRYYFFNKKYPIIVGAPLENGNFWLTLKEILALSLPIVLGGMILPLTQSIDSALIINILMRGGSLKQEATAAYGLLGGTVGSLINMPAVLSLSIATAVLPAISHYNALHSQQQLKHKAGEALRFCWLIALPSFVGLLVLAQPIISLLYGRGLSQEEQVLAAYLLRIGSVSVIFIALTQVFTVILQGLGRSKIPLFGLCAGAAAKIILTLILVPKLGVSGAAISSAACFLITALWCGFFVAKYALAHEQAKNFSYTALSALSAALMGGLAHYSYAIMLPPLGRTLALFGAITIAALSYGLALLALGVVRKTDIERIPFLKKKHGQTNAKKWP